jgi:hypothetical protein
VVTFPATPLDLTVEVLLGGTWTELANPNQVYGRDDVTVTRGRPNEATTVERSTCSLTANNRSGNLSPRNPTGSYYGLIGRNTRMRVRLDPASPGYLLMVNDDRASTPDSANLSITGDIDIRLDIQPTSWAAAQGLANKYLSTGNQRSWALWLNADSTLSFRWSADGSTTITKTSTAAVSPPASGRLAVRVTLDVDNGAAGNDVKFYTANTISGSWSQLGATVTTAGTTSIFDSTASVEIGGSQGNGSANDLTGRLYAAQVYQGIAGTLRADVDFDDEEAGAASFVDGSGNTWTLLADASIVDPAVRFVGEVSEWPPRWDISGTDVYVPLEASGILRRLTQGSSPLKSTLYRGLTSLANPPKAYWPCEDSSDATRIASGIGGPPMTVLGAFSPAQFDGFKCSSALPVLVATSDWIGSVPTYTGTGNIQVWCLLNLPAGAATSGQNIIGVYTTGTVALWLLEYATGGDLRLRAYNSAGTQLLDSGVLNFNLDDKLVRVGIQLEQNGADINWSIDTLEVGASAAVGTGGTLAAQTVSRCHSVRVNGGGDLGDNIAVGHIAVHNEILSLFELADQLNAYVGEAAGRRIERLCGEEGVTFRGVGELDTTAAMGAQLSAELVDLLQEAADADGGLLYEPRDLFGLAYRTRESLYNQDAALALDYAANHLGSGSDTGIEPTDDDQQVRNDVTVKRTGGSSVRAVLETGALSILDPPDGVGRYDTEVTLNLESDAQVPDAAGWLLWLGTVDEARYPVLMVDLSRAPFVADSSLVLAVQDLDLGDRLTVDNPPAWLPPDAISQLAQGMVETMGNFTHRIAVNCSPETPWGRVGVYDDPDSRYSSDGSTLNEALTTTETDVDVATPSGPLWSHDDGNFNIRIGGEVMTVTAISGASSPQTFTVTRSVNGVVKAHSTGAEVALDHPVVYVR